ncbi:MAG: HD domain-containing protein [Deltaproteobacteria bacterium]|nr:HD domain-containing protein [Deltaproteobacteria bacterium]NIS76043.1 HD domain-containing protein [Deltaproteobacteria bacterium]
MLDIERTIEFIKDAHRGQVDKNGNPYYEHPLRVMRRLGAGATDVEKVAALLHDVVEDTEWEIETLRQRGYPAEVLEIVRLLSENHFPGLTYLQHVEALISLGNLSAMRVKLADIADNLSPSRVAVLPEEARYLVGRYEKAKEKLIAAAGPAAAGGIIWGELEKPRK